MERKTVTAMSTRERLKRDALGRKKKKNKMKMEMKMKKNEMKMKKKMKKNPLLERKKKKLKRNPDMMVMKKLDPDMHLEIFSLLTFKEAVQCRFVCKSWRTLLDDNFLINIHAKTLLKLHGYDHHHAHHSSSSSSIVSFISFSREKTSLLFGFYDDNLCSYKESSFNDSSLSNLLEGTTMVNSCNGLICLYTGPTGYPHTIAIYNPVTTEFLRLHWDYKGRVVNGGLGYHPSTQEYKILRTIINYGTSSHCHQIYTFGTTGRWKDIEGCRSFIYDVPGVHVNGALYWITEYGGSFIMSFDLADEEFRILTMLPPLLKNMKPKLHYKLVESQGCLFLFVDQYSSPDDPHIELWVMKEKDIDHDYGFRYYWSNLMEISIVGHRKKGDYEFLALTQSGKALFWHNSVLTCFDPKTERFASISDVPASLGRFCSFPAIVPHTNSLVSFNSLGAFTTKHMFGRRIYQSKLV